ncbi:MAG: succinate dehydrogenase iron-sulfur subunit [Candidatus Eremiobacteraeota bacterium]|nr:succinate dehydrogenase iron-sulfur subunit [Candidatus Eremiobacteraeota bacterium]
MEKKHKGDQFIGREITFKVLRYDPGRDKKPYLKAYQFVLERGMTVLDGLMHIKETQDNTLAYRKSCRMGVCGSCGMLVNGKPVLACQTQISELGRAVVEVRPLPNYPLIRDVVPDLTQLFDKHQHIKPHIIRENWEEQDSPTAEYLQTPAELEQYLQFSYCIKCGCCIAACPTSSTDESYIGAQALGQCYRYAIDSRDEGFQQRIPLVDFPQGIWRCHFPGACSEACPKGVDPAFAIQLLKKEITLKILGMKKDRQGAKLAGPQENPRVVADVPAAPQKTAGK